MSTATPAAMAPEIELDAALKARILALAARRGESPGRLVDAALERLEQEERERREEELAFYQEALQSEREFRENGLHITGEELFAWFERLKTDPEAPMPPCHT